MSNKTPKRLLKYNQEYKKTLPKEKKCEYIEKYRASEKGKEAQRKAQNDYAKRTNYAAQKKYQAKMRLAFQNGKKEQLKNMTGTTIEHTLDEYDDIE